jgi:thiaminase/transcriptional activator TenA
MTPSGVAQSLWQANQDLARACLDSSFVRGLFDGRLPRECFQRYLAQDAYFLEAFARAYAMALARAPDRDGLHAFSDLIQGVLEELNMHAGYARRWNVSLNGVQPGSATAAYVDFLGAVSADQGAGDICAAMTPCMRLYAWLGQTLAARRPGRHDYTEWIETYSAPGFEALAARLESLLDRYADGASRAPANYRRALELERAFFEAHA